jgi:3-oxoacyl-[acyl-carrier protein] reductase
VYYGGEPDRIFDVNAKGTFFASRQAAKRVADGGRIINISSSTTVMMLANYSAYVVLVPKSEIL